MVKYADSPSTSVEISIDAPPSVVWPILCDINAPAAFSHEFQGAEWVDGDRPAVGNTFRGTNEHPVVGQWSVTCTITAFEPERVFEWTIGDPEFKAAQWRLELAEEGDGSIVRFRSEIGPGPSGLSPAIDRMPDREDEIVDKRMAEHNANMQRTVEGYKALAEAAAGRGQ